MRLTIRKKIIIISTFIGLMFNCMFSSSVFAKNSSPIEPNNQLHSLSAQILLKQLNILEQHLIPVEVPYEVHCKDKKTVQELRKCARSARKRAEQLAIKQGIDKLVASLSEDDIKNAGFTKDEIRLHVTGAIVEQQGFSDKWLLKERIYTCKIHALVKGQVSDELKQELRIRTVPTPTPTRTPTLFPSPTPTSMPTVIPTRTPTPFPMFTPTAIHGRLPTPIPSKKGLEELQKTLPKHLEKYKALKEKEKQGFDLNDEIISTTGDIINDLIAIENILEELAETSPGNSEILKRITRAKRDREAYEKELLDRLDSANP